MTPEQLRECPIDQCAENTDREIYRGPDDGCGDYYSDSLHITAEGALGIDCDGYVVVKPIRTWHGLAKAHAAALEEVERLKAERDRAFEKLAIDAVQYDALLAERDRERKEHAQWVRDHQADTDAAHRAKQRAESALAEAERKCERLEAEHYEALLIQKKKMQEVIDYWQGIAESRADKGE